MILAPRDFAQVLQVADVIDLCEEARAASIATLDHVPCDAGAEPVATGHGRDPCKTVRHSRCRAHAGPRGRRERPSGKVDSDPAV